MTPDILDPGSGCRRGPSWSLTINHVKETPAVVNSTQRIRKLNDELRQHLVGGLAVMTPGVAALGQQAVEPIVQKISVFDDFCHANDPHDVRLGSLTAIKTCSCIVEHRRLVARSKLRIVIVFDEPAAGISRLREARP
jgi:hypothetical protein